MSLANQWTGVTTKAKSTAFQASANASNAGPVTSWNCGGAHTLRDCKQKRDQKKIEAAKKKHREAAKENGQGGCGDQGRSRGEGQGGCGGRGGRRGRGAGKGPDPKWGEPTKNEKKSNNERLINGKVYPFNTDTKNWNPKDGAQGNVAAASTTVPSSITTTTTPSALSAEQQARRAASVAQLTQTFQSVRIAARMTARAKSLQLFTKGT
jgi:hypothetical protein